MREGSMSNIAHTLMDTRCGPRGRAIPGRGGTERRPVAVGTVWRPWKGCESSDEGGRDVPYREGGPECEIGVAVAGMESPMAYRIR